MPDMLCPVYTGNSLSSFDFDSWRDLAERDPNAFFRERDRLLQNFIAERPENASDLRSLQSHIDQVRALTGNPDAATRELTRMLAERLEVLTEHLSELNAQTKHLQAKIANADNH